MPSLCAGGLLPPPLASAKCGTDTHSHRQFAAGIEVVKQRRIDETAFFVHERGWTEIGEGGDVVLFRDAVQGKYPRGSAKFGALPVPIARLRAAVPSSRPVKMPFGSFSYSPPDGETHFSSRPKSVSARVLASASE